MTVLLAAMVLAAPVPRLAEPEVSEATIRAWQDAGAEVRWVTKSGLWDDTPKIGSIVGFRFHGWMPGRAEKLPLPEGPFHLDISFPWPGDDRKGVAKELNDEGLKEIAGFRTMRSISVFGNDITDDGVSEIAKLRALVHIDLSCTRITAKGLKGLSALPNVTRLGLSQMDVTEEMLEQVAMFRGLQRLSVSHGKGQLNSVGVSYLAEMNQLAKLEFFGIDFEKDSVGRLGRSKSLRSLDFLNTNVTQKERELLGKLLPECRTEVRWSISVDSLISP
jgi:hypothetical protein